MRRMKEGSVVAPMPVLPIPRSMLEIYRKDTRKPTGRQQLILNYCFGHTNSSLLFFPYSSSVHFINHNGENPNAYIRWSDSPLSKHENFERTPRQVHTGLIMEVVALRDINLGEEVMIDYGMEWSRAWDAHVRNWHGSLQANEESDILHNSPAHVAKEWNQNQTKPIRTVQEQKDDPYPLCIRTACHSQESNGTYVYTQPDFENLRFCHVQNRVWKGNQYWYDATMERSEFHQESVVNDDYLVTDIPRYAIRFIVGEYCSDLHFQFGFRHEIGVPHDLYPDVWLNDGNDEMVDQDKEVREVKDNKFTDDDYYYYDEDDSHDAVPNNVQEKDRFQEL